MKNIKEELFTNNLLIPISIEGIEKILFQMKNCTLKQIYYAIDII